MSASSPLRVAIRLHQSGHTTEAEKAYRQALADTPKDPDAIHGLGVLLGQRGELAQATQLIRQAIDLRPAAAAYYNSLGNVLQQQDMLDDAERQFHFALSISPMLAEVHFNLGNTLHRLGRTDECLSAYRAALAIRPDHAPTHAQIGIALLAVDRAEEAIQPLAQAVGLKQGFVNAHAAYALALERVGNNAAAEEQYRILVSLPLTRAEWWRGLGRTLLAQGRGADAVVALEHGLQRSPQLPELHHYLGLARLHWYQGPTPPDHNQLEQAIASFERFVELRPDSSEGWKDLGQACLCTGDGEEAIACLKRAVLLDQGNAEAHGALGLALLTEGNLTDGWTEYEWRWKCPSYQAMRTFSAPLWNGSPLDSGKTLLLHTEQGFGDAIQFVRYASMLAQSGQSIIVECQQELLRLFRSLKGLSVYARDDLLPAFDAHSPLMSVPHRLGTSLATVPANVPYLFAEPAARARWRERLAALPPGLRVGLVWAGNPERRADYTRSLNLGELSPLSATEGVVWVSLQKGPAAKQIPPAGMLLHDFSSELTDFADTAALATNLDLVITVDTAVAHLAGALALPAWVLLANGDVWRWMRQRSDSPWYPTLRLFRQTELGDWHPALKALSEALRDRLALVPRTAEKR